MVFIVFVFFLGLLTLNSTSAMEENIPRFVEKIPNPIRHLVIEYLDTKSRVKYILASKTTRNDVLNPKVPFLWKFNCNEINRGALMATNCKRTYLRNFLHLPMERISASGLEFLVIENCQELIPSRLPQSLTFLEINSTRCQDMSSLCNLTKLEFLKLNDTETTEISNNISRLRELRTLEISSSAIESIPDEICDLEKLIHLNLNHTNLKTLPKNLHLLKKLEVIELNVTHFKNFPIHLSDFPNLRYFIFQPLNPVLDLHASYYIQNIGAVSHIMLAKKDNRTWQLDLRNNDIHNLPQRFFSISNIDSLGLASNELRALPYDFSCLTIKTLDLSMNQFEMIPSCLQSMNCIEKLIISNNKLTTLDMGSLPPTLKVLDASYNKISKFINIEQTPKTLKKINLLCNEMTDIPLFLEQISNLTRLNLGSNPLDKVDLEKILNFSNLSYLCLSDTQLKVISFTPFRNLKNLCIQNNYDLISVNFGNKTHIQKLLMDHRIYEKITQQVGIKGIDELTLLVSIPFHKHKLGSNCMEKDCKFNKL